MASVTIRNLDERVMARLRTRAAKHGRSIGDEAREILTNALAMEPKQPGGLATAIRNRFAPLGGVELPEIMREPIRRTPTQN